MFAWDVAKAKLNETKHQVSFEEAATVFADSEGLDIEDEKHSEKERRHLRVGVSCLHRILVVVYTLRRAEHGKTIIRIISARQASKKERAAYARQ